MLDQPEHNLAEYLRRYIGVAPPVDRPVGSEDIAE
jgi:hypothetical protein